MCLCTHLNNVSSPQPYSPPHTLNYSGIMTIFAYHYVLNISQFLEHSRCSADSVGWKKISFPSWYLLTAPQGPPTLSSSTGQLLRLLYVSAAFQGQFRCHEVNVLGLIMKRKEVGGDSRQWEEHEQGHSGRTAPGGSEVTKLRVQEDSG